jgi:hypothetical protein
VSGVGRGGLFSAGDELDAGPDAAGILPAAAAAAEPFAEDGAGGDLAAVVLGEGALAEGARIWPAERMQREMRQASRLAPTAKRLPSGMPLTRGLTSSEAAAVFAAGEAGEEGREAAGRCLRDPPATRPLAMTAGL